MIQLVIFLTLVVILVNGWTDAPNAIATAISTKTIAPKPAILLAAGFNFLGIWGMTMINKTVAETIYKMVDFGSDTRQALIGLAAAMTAIIGWAVVAWCFGIPTSESQALFAGLTGAAMALHGGLSGVNQAEWIKILWGLGLSTVLGFAGGYGITRLIETIFRNFDRRKTKVLFKNAQLAGAATMSFMHGAQDGQKFMGVFLLVLALNKGQSDIAVFEIPYWLVLLCSLVMSFGTSLGGYRIIKAVGMDLVKLETYQGFAADLAGAGCLLICSLTGIPVSTSQTKTAAVMGVGTTKGIRQVDWSLAGEMIFTWLLTFPGCGVIGYLLVKLLSAVF